jgi:hypothetical protein
MSPVIFQTAEDYQGPLLRLLTTLEGGQGRSSDIIRLFGEMYKENIPDWHHERLTTGDIRWKNYVYWARHHLIERGFMDSPAYVHLAHHRGGASVAGGAPGCHPAGAHNAQRAGPPGAPPSFGSAGRHPGTTPGHQSRDAPRPVPRHLGRTLRPPAG